MVAVKPSLVRVVLICTDSGGDGTYAEHDEVDLLSILEDNNNTNQRLISITVDTTNISIGMGSFGIELAGKNSSTGAALNKAKWKFKVYAAY